MDKAGEQSAARGIYVASRASLPERGCMWRKFRGEGSPIVSSWIDEDGEGETEDFSELWLRIMGEIRRSGALVLYVEPDDFPLKGALIEVGISIALGLKVIVCAPGVELQGRTFRPLGSWVKHPAVKFENDIVKAMKLAEASTAEQSPEPRQYVCTEHNEVNCFKCQYIGEFPSGSVGESPATLKAARMLVEGLPFNLSAYKQGEIVKIMLKFCGGGKVDE